MSYTGESSVEARERQQREQEAEAFLTSLTPSLVAGAPTAKKSSPAGAQNGLEFFSFYFMTLILILYAWVVCPISGCLSEKDYLFGSSTVVLVELAKQHCKAKAL